MEDNSSNISASNESSWLGADYVVQRFYFVVLALCIVLLNASVIMAVFRKRILRKPENYLLASLAFSDLNAGLIGLPLVLMCSMSPPEECQICHTAFSFTNLMSISTILHLVAVTSERYFLIVRPFYNCNGNCLHTGGLRFKISLFVIWFVSLTVAALPFTWVNINKCDGAIVVNIDIVYNITRFVLFFVLPMLVLIYEFLSIFVVARTLIRKNQALIIPTEDQGNSRTTSCVAKEARVALVFVFMWSAFLLCWSPYFILGILDNVGIEPELPEWLWIGTNLLRFLTSLLNPLLYSFLKEDFFVALRLRRVVKIIKCQCLCRDQPTRSATQQNYGNPKHREVVGIERTRDFDKIKPDHCELVTYQSTV